jgi:ubiquitin-like domain-containing CTD phosphatase 1
MNPQSGLKIRAYKNSVVTRSSDNELLYLLRYFRLIGSYKDFRALDHSKWKDLLKQNAQTQ